MNYDINKLEKEYKVRLDDAQRKALSDLTSFITSDEHCICLTGSAGTSKSMIASMLYDILADNGYWTAFIAPTNKAKLVLESKGMKGREALTIHSLLNLRPNLNVLNFDASQLEFNFLGTSFKRSHQVYKYDVLIVDECSMINSDLYDLLLKEYKSSKIVFVGDPKQLYSVKENKPSKAFSNRTIYLNKIYRQKESCLSKVLNYLREKPLYKFKSISDDYSNITVYNNIVQMLKKYSYLFKISKDFSDSNLIKLVSYTNNRINALNKLIREYLGYKEEFVVGEVLTGYDTTNYLGLKIENSRDYIITSVNKTKYLELNAWELGLKSDDSTFKVIVLSKDNSEKNINNLAYRLEGLRLSAVNADKNNVYKKRVNALWSKYYDLSESFLTTFDLRYDNRIIKRKSLDYGYCISTHKSQSSQYSIVMIDMENIWRCTNKEELRQLQYVACSRTTSDLIIYQKDDNT